ncbi:NAD(P)-dependent oxidoreductase, partial [Patulibacter sp. S7RM1-6]
MSPQRPSAPLLVLAPRDDGPERLAGVPGVRAVGYDPADPTPPAEGRDAEAVVVAPGHVDATLELLGRLPRLRLVQTLSAGFDVWEGRVPDGVAISNVRGAHGRATAELAVALLLAQIRELPRFGAAQARGAWEPVSTGSLAGARVLILGAGDLGRHAAAMLAPFGTETTLVGRSAREGVVALDAVDALLPEQDAVVCVLPLNDATRGTIDAAFLARLPDGAIVVNAGRGPLVDTEALLAELQAGRLRAGLDVVDPEPLPDDHPLWGAPGALLTPHVGGDTTGFEDRQWAVAGEALAAVARGERP